jgi:hypothetical protein
MNAPCAGQWKLFDSTDLVDHVRARQLCETCPIRATICTDSLKAAKKEAGKYGANYGPLGTWAGQLHSAHPIPIHVQLNVVDAGEETYDLVKAIAAEFGTTADHILGTTRRVDVARARHVLCWLLHTDGVSLSEIGRRIGRDHTTVHHAVRRVERDAELQAKAVAIRDRHDALEAA